MAYEVKDNSGSLFKNERKQQDSHPDYNGNCRIDGTDYWISAWLKEGKTGVKFFSFSFKQKDGTAARPEAKPTGETKDFIESQKSTSFSLDDEVPF